MKAAMLTQCPHLARWGLGSNKVGVLRLQAATLVACYHCSYCACESTPEVAAHGRTGISAGLCCSNPPIETLCCRHISTCRQLQGLHKAFLHCALTAVRRAVLCLCTNILCLCRCAW